MKYQIRESVAEDMPAVLKLIKELAIFEREADAVEMTTERLIKDGFGSEKLFHCFVGVIDKNVEGMALLYPRYSTWKGPVIHLEDLIVSEGFRGSGLGTALLNEVVKYGAKLGVKRISWDVLDWNSPAIEFYEKKGAKVLRDWDVVHLDEKGIQEYLSNL
ncbi:MAG: GNAT family N-acetyltransferase [Eudoraea sp.]|nr:GNAT family N-acetyltransferase [Eudoraea sp.]